MAVEASNEPVPAGQWVHYRGVLVRVVETTMNGHRFEFKPATRVNQKRAVRRDVDKGARPAVD